jgi:anion-transporting  ArsA/GET3 family ATPase
LVSGQPQGAEGGGWLGAAAAGSYSVMTKRQQALDKDQDLRDALTQQKQQIVALQDERAQLNECVQEETPLAQCGTASTATDKAPEPDKSDEPDWNASQYDLEKQIQMQQDYIAKLQDQVWTLKHQMQSQ